MSKNLLSQEKSPYLLQHQENPVHWQPWGEAAFAAAKKQEKPIFLSIGYSTCHWCHVMAHESFEDESVAAYINEHFIPIKLDREERPDIDEIYMAAIQAMGQRGGWPLSIFLTPELKPFYGGTYWPKEQFLYVLQQLKSLWEGDREKALKSSEGLIEHLKESKLRDLGQGELKEELLKNYLDQSASSYDQVWGGFSTAPKFPHATQLSLLLRIHHRKKEASALQMVIHTLEKMATGGLYDHLGGGFARYSVDAQWAIPHFEKMLYDNALLAHVYLEAYQVTGIEMFLSVARGTLDYVLRVLTHSHGGFYSAEDADSEGEEGKFYVWTLEELKSHLNGEEFAKMSEVFAISPQGNFEKATNHFLMHREVPWGAKADPLIQSAMDKLFQIREGRIHPHLDDKILTAWNGLMIRAMAKAFQVTREEKYLKAARDAAQFIQSHLMEGEKLLARYREGEAKFAGRLEDYAYLIEGLLELYQCEFDPKTFEWILKLQEQQDKDFLDSEKGGYYFSDGRDPHVLIRSKEAMEGAIPNANGVSALNLLRIFDYQGDLKFRDQAGALFRYFSKLLSEYPIAVSQLTMALDYQWGPSRQLALLGPKEDSQIQVFLPRVQAVFNPYLLVALGESGQELPNLLTKRQALSGKTTAYLCENQACQKPSQDLEKTLSDLSQKT